jgi:hypothetical protein
MTLHRDTAITAFSAMVYPHGLTCRSSAFLRVSRLAFTSSPFFRRVRSVSMISQLMIIGIVFLICYVPVFPSCGLLRVLTCVSWLRAFAVPLPW